MLIHNVISEVSDGQVIHRDFNAIEGFAVHRMGVDLKWDNVLGYEPVSICAAFTGKEPKWKEVAKATGGQNAYSIMIGGDLGPAEYDGKVWQTIALDDVGYHARRFSVPYLGIGVISDARYKPISQKQRNSLVDLLVELCIGWARDPMTAIKGHGEIAGSHDGSKAPGKPNWCPGFDMDPIRAEVAALMQEQGRRKLSDAGLVFSS